MQVQRFSKSFVAATNPDRFLWGQVAEVRRPLSLDLLLLGVAVWRVGHHLAYVLLSRHVSQQEEEEDAA